MGWQKTKRLLVKIEQLALPTKVSSLLLALLLGALLGGGLQTLSRTSTPSVPELPRWRSETLKTSGHSESIQKNSVIMKTDFARLNGNIPNGTGGTDHE